jgi:hypothetical protein
MIKKILLILVVLMFMLDCSYAAEVTYYFDSYDSEWESGTWATDPENMADGSTETAAVSAGAGTQNNQRLDGNTCGGTVLGTITKVEIRLYGDETDAGTIFVQPVYIAGEGNGLAIFPGGGWSSYRDITNEGNAPSPWEWSDVSALETYIVKFDDDSSAEAAKVEIRVTYTDTGTVFQIAGD